jgi:cyclomaltodextrinase
MTKNTEIWQFYHIYPLGFCNAPKYNDLRLKPTFRLDLVRKWVSHLKSIGINALYFGPIFESTHHGYDIIDYYDIDRRLGTLESVKTLFEFLHESGFKIIIDGIFNHTGRDFWAFKDIQKNGQNSRYNEWYSNLNFTYKSSYNDDFSYDSWNGCDDLVKLNLYNKEVRNHLFGAVKMWIEYLKIDGIRLDSCDSLDLTFIKELCRFSRKLDPNIWLMGEIIHGDYRKWVNDEMLDSVTNYVCYKGLWSSLNDSNFFEIAYTLNQQYGANGMYSNLLLYNFVDNHDVNRAASILNNSFHLYPLYIMLYTIPGIPSIYYGSEWGWSGKKIHSDDYPLRPFIEIEQVENLAPHLDLKKVIIKLSKIRAQLKEIRLGSYFAIHTAFKQFIYCRKLGNDEIIIAINSDNREVEVELKKPINGYDILNDEDVKKNSDRSLKIYPNWGRIIKKV